MKILTLEQIKQKQIDEFKRIIDEFKKSDEFKISFENKINDKLKRSDLTLAISVSKYDKQARIQCIYANDKMLKTGFSAHFEKPSNQLNCYYEIL